MPATYSISDPHRQFEQALSHIDFAVKGLLVTPLNTFTFDTCSQVSSSPDGEG